jgi:hypothetical protein
MERTVEFGFASQQLPLRSTATSRFTAHVARPARSIRNMMLRNVATETNRAVKEYGYSFLFPD